MDTTLWKQITADAISNEIFKNWITYVILFGFTVLNVWLTSMVGAYYKKRGETLATKADMNEILEQVRKTTEATEVVRTSIAQADWAAREWNSLRRKKLEELLDAARSMSKIYDSLYSKWVNESDETVDETPEHRVPTITALYFPELSTQSAQLMSHHQQASHLILQTGSTLASTHKANLTARDEIMRKHIAAWRPCFNNYTASVSALEAGAANLMSRLVSIS